MPGGTPAAVARRRRGGGGLSPVARGPRPRLDPRRFVQARCHARSADAAAARAAAGRRAAGAAAGRPRAAAATPTARLLAWRRSGVCGDALAHTDEQVSYEAALAPPPEPTHRVARKVRCAEGRDGVPEAVNAKPGESRRRRAATATIIPPPPPLPLPPRPPPPPSPPPPPPPSPLQVLALFDRALHTDLIEAELRVLPRGA